MTDLEFENAVNAYINMLYRVAFNYLKSKEDSEDAIQNTFIRLYHCKKGFKSEEHLKAWLIRVTINESKRIINNNKKHAAVDIEKVAHELYADETTKSDFSIELMKLNPTYSTVLYLYYYEGYTTEQIAKFLHCRESTVRSRLTRARKKLRSYLGGMSDE